MKHDYLLGTPEAVKLYGRVRSLPIYDYHCHLSPEEIYLDREFTDISGMWLSGDHYKWQLMRLAGIDEKYITGDAGGMRNFSLTRRLSNMPREIRFITGRRWSFRCISG